MKPLTETSDVDNEGSELRRSSRERQRTEPMEEYMNKRAKVHRDRLKDVYEQWRGHARVCKESAKKECQETEYGDLVDKLKRYEQEVIENFELLRNACPPTPDIVRKVDACVSVTAEISTILNERIAGVSDFDPSCFDKLKRNEYAHSIFSKTLSASKSVRSDISHNSVSSRLSNRIADAAADLVEKTAELAAREEEIKHKVKFEQQRAELKKTEAKKDVHVAAARLNVLKKAEEHAFLDNVKSEPFPVLSRQLHEHSASWQMMPNSLTGEENTLFAMPQFQSSVSRGTAVTPGFHSSVSSDNHVLSTPSYVTNITPRTGDVQHGSSSVPPTTTHVPQLASNLSYKQQGVTNPAPVSKEQTSTDATTTALAKAITESLNMSRLPVPEPGIFTGDPLKFLEWKTSFETLIDKKGISEQEKIYYLRRYVNGAAKTAIEGYFYSSSTSAYESGRKVLNERYGHPFVIQKAFRDKLDRWPRIASKDPLALRDFADFLQSCRDATPYVAYLSVLDDCAENQKMLSKLPEWLVTRWNREVTSALEINNVYPKFRQFVDFIVKEAKIACNPVSSPFALSDERRSKESKGNKMSAKSLTTNVNESTGAPKKADREQRPCVYCDRKGHFIQACKNFNELTIEDKRSFIQQQKLCFGCLRKGHRNNECRRKLTCDVCKGRHPSCMHEERSNNDHVKEATSFKVNRNAPCERQSTSMIVPVWISTERNPTCEILTYALLDTQSDTTFIHEDTSAALQVERSPIKLSLSTMTSQQTVIDSQRITGLLVRGFTSAERLSINCAYTRGFIPVDRTHIPTRDTAKQWKHLQEISSAIPPLQSCDVGLLIGYNCPPALAPRRIITGVESENEPYAVQTSLGWSIVGCSNLQLHEGVSRPNVHLCIEGVSHRTCVKDLPPVTPRDAIKALESDFAHDSVNDVKVSQEDIMFLNTMNDNVYQRNDKHLEMPLPFKERPILPNNRGLALTRLSHLKRKLSRDEQYHKKYRTFMNEMVERGDAELVPEKSASDCQWYIPHHGVFHPKKPYKLRIVFDCSARYQNTSLNQHLLTGPDLTNGLAGVLVRFRRFPIAIMCDVEKMFHQFFVCEPDRDFLRFVWWEDGVMSSEPKDFRMRKHLFGAASSPACANYGLKHLAKCQEEQYPEAASFVQNDFYVDDGLTSVKNEIQAVQLVKDARTVCSNGGLRLHKFVSNSKTVIESIPASERADDVKDLDLNFENLPVERALGVKWSIEKDVFNFEVTVKNTSPSRRNMLSIVASIFDPLGFLSPLVLTGKRILQEMCQTGVGWDYILSSDKRPEWDGWIKDLRNLDRVNIQRCILPRNIGSQMDIELHHFSDASSSGYGQCTYVRFVDGTSVHCALLIGKARVAPTKVVTIPRLELTAAVLSVKTSLFLKKELGLPISREIFWTDSRVVLGYIRNEARRFHVFVANRVQVIRDATDVSQWFYVESGSNPADHASRGLTAQEITSSTWLKGPQFLWEKEIPETKIESYLQLGDPEVKSVRSLCTQGTLSTDVIKRFDRFSSWLTVVSVTARIIRLAKGIRGIHSPSGEERRNAELSILRLLQRGTFQNELDIMCASDSLPRTSKLFPLDPLLCDGVLRVGGRLREADSDDSAKHPVILPRDEHITSLIISYVHQKVQHQGRGFTLNQLRAYGYWIVGGSKMVSNFIRQCVICRKLRRPAETQRMADLPKDRVVPSPPFTYCGMDCFGPFVVKQGRKDIKRYGLLFTCFCSRAVHIEMLDDMSTDSFINGLRCFISIRGPVRQIRSDKGSNFIGASNEFEKEAKRINEFLLNKQCDFKFNAPNASHTGGVWERQIRTVRSILNAILAQHPGRLDDSSLRTVFYEVMAIVNSRPLTVSDINDPSAPEALTPNHILTGKSGIAPPPPGNFVREDLYARKRWRRVQYVLEQFWSRWKREYIGNIALRQKWHAVRRNMRVGDIVLIVDSDLSRN